MVTIKQNDFVWVTLKQKKMVTLKQKQPTVGNLNQNNPLWVTFQHLRLSVGVYRPAEWRTGLNPIFLCMDCYWWLQNTQRVNANVTDIHDNEESPLHTMKNPHYTPFFRHIQCE